MMLLNKEQIEKIWHLSDLEPILQLAKSYVVIKPVLVKFISPRKLNEPEIWSYNNPLACKPTQSSRKEEAIATYVG